MRLIDADELKKDDEVNLWLSNDAVRSGKTLKMFSELFIKKIDEQPTVEAIPKAEYENCLNADKVNTLEGMKYQIDELIQDVIDKLKEKSDE